MKKAIGIIIFIIIVFSIVSFLFLGFLGLITFVIISEDEESIVEYEENIGSGNYTLMIYMCGSDLETEDGSASRDITEMLKAKIDPKLNVILETGGAQQWQEHGISSEKNQIYKVNSNELKLINDTSTNMDMANPETLENFISFCKDNYPADKYGLILWDHGGGAISGFGYDENFEDLEDTLTIDELKFVLENSNIKFDFVGFDACLMANIETAYSLKNSSNYLIASEESEPGTGWEYTGLINKLSSNTSQDASSFAKFVVDGFIKDNNSFLDFEDATLSVIDLSKVDNLFNILTDFVIEIDEEELNKEDFLTVSKAISKTKSFADGEMDTIDLLNFAEIVNNDKSKELIDSIKDTVVYCKNTDLVENSNGISIYWPYQDLSYYDQMLYIYNNIGINEKYTNVLTKFANYMAGGKIGTYSINNHSYNIGDDYSQYNWYDSDFIENYENYYEDYSYNEDLEIVKKGDYYILELDDTDWDIITNITCEVMVDDGEGYIDLGSDDYFEVDDDNNLIIDFDCTWITINDCVVPYYAIDDSKKYMGKVPAYLNDEEVNLIIVWDDEKGKVAGAEPVNKYGNTTLSHKGLIPINKGDKLEFLFDYYTYDGEYEDSYLLYDSIYVTDELNVEYEIVDEDSFYVYYKITDIYNNKYYTEAIVIS